jgi:adenine-specific DNA-methyltransferase
LRTRDEVGADKIRGGFYSPEPLVRACLDRVEALAEGRQELRVLEPSAGDGAFIRGMARHRLAQAVASLCAVELVEPEAERAAAALREAPFRGRVITASTIAWAIGTAERFDAAVGNPPFVRFQFLSEADKAALPRLSAQIGASFAGVANLWIPVLMAALSRLAPGGVLAFIIPAECFTGISGRVVREWFGAWVEELQFDLFPPGSFPLVLQEVVVVSGRKRNRPRNGPAWLTVHEHDRQRRSRSWTHRIDDVAHTWTQYLLEPEHLAAVAESAALSAVQAVGQVAKFEVAAVTGANEFFSVDRSTADRYQLTRWAVPLLPRVRHAPGLRYTAQDHAATVASGAKSMLLDFSADLPDPTMWKRPASYLAAGVADGLPLRYKCRIRQPWYRVPWIGPGRLMLSKRSHHHPRVILNEAGVVTTDTIYRGRLLSGFERRDLDFTASFHNSLTLLTAEMEGRSFGGGVLELVPSEVGRLLVPLPDGFGEHLGRLDGVLRSASQPGGMGSVLVEETDRLLVKADIGLGNPLMELLHDARTVLLRRRMDRNAG